MKKSKVYSIFLNPFIVSVFLLTILIFIALHPFFGFDESLWSYIGRIWNRNGIPPYIGSVENKTPGVFILFAISDYIFNGSILFVRIIGIFAIITSSYFIYLFCKKVHSKLSGILAMCIFSLVMSWSLLDGFCFAQTETFMLLFSIIAFYFITHTNNKRMQTKMLLLAGLSMGMAISFKQIAITTLIALFVFFLIYSSQGKTKVQKVIGVIIISTGVILSFLAIYLILLIFGVSLIEYIEGTWLILINKGSKAPNFETRVNNFADIFIYSKFTIFYLFLFLAFYKTKILKNKYFIGLFIWLIIDFIGVNASGYYYGHQIKQLLIPIVILSGIGIADFFYRKFFSNDKNMQMLFVVTVISLFFPYKQFKHTVSLIRENQEIPIYEELGEWIEKSTDEKDYIYVLGENANLVKTLYCSNRLSSSRYFHSIFITSDVERQIVFKDLQNNPPFYILNEINFPIVKELYGENTFHFINEKYTSFYKKDNYEILKRNTK
ncbi:glycosyltransferase family 39 protein [Flavivirga aquimarina]|uniref:Glycosyltransferase family 39 protein n=2 Tax=Flavivirga aquimarina TaxID=2027862 RepID=A0ABT8WBA2_9FLAO|nr:glycosyltransferase family 39 protein [Flavivirga aquimarina]MDO5970429.1 glycosyltransferase family 39 protein [Flavivirga aquimarina]